MDKKIFILLCSNGVLILTYVLCYKTDLDNFRGKITFCLLIPPVLHPSALRSYIRTLVKSALQKNNYFISQPKHMLWVLKLNGSF